ncbi:hypothetical protein J1N35_012483 [Gossypium stocksii]|uniref:Uncharacterized protein n=1 Tax=Gossypium stocksii TaxID=47602 RepID=A0A9D3W6E5_9ROSI|nr:hypothetical protein J1N35_012483 [Gossypium stocksii]
MEQHPLAPKMVSKKLSNFSDMVNSREGLENAESILFLPLDRSNDYCKGMLVVRDSNHIQLIELGVDLVLGGREGWWSTLVVFCETSSLGGGLGYM